MKMISILILLSIFTISNLSAEGDHQGQQHQDNQSSFNEDRQGPRRSNGNQSFSNERGRQGQRGSRDNQNSFNMEEELNLNEDQKEQLRNMRYEEKKHRMNLQLKELDLRHELEAAVPNEEKIYAIIPELKELQGISIELRVKSVLTLRKILTPEQYKKFKQLSNKRRTGKGNRKMKRNNFDAS